LGEGSLIRIGTAIRRLKSRDFLRSWFLAFGSSVGALSGLVALLPRVDLTLTRSLLILTCCVVVATAYAIASTRLRHLPVDELAPATLTPGPYMSVVLQCNRSLLAQVHDLASIIYGDDVTAIPFEQYEQWLTINCNILACLIDRNHRALGYFDVLPLRDSFAREFIEGTVGELDIRGIHILPPNEARRCQYLYLAGFAVADPGTSVGSRHASCLLWALRRYLEFFYQFDNKHLLAVGATPEGERVLQRFNFQLAQVGRLRKDKYAIYAARLSSRLIQSASTVPDWSGACRLSWEESAKALTRASQRQRP